MADFACRVAVPADAPVLLGMMAQFNAAEGIDFEPQAARAPLLELIDAPALGLVPVFELAGQTAGYAVVTWNFDLEYGGRDAFLTELWLEPAHRGKGLGKAALRAIEDLCRTHKAAALHLAVRPDNDVAVRLYTSYGYSDWPRRVLSKSLRSQRPKA
jgi:ribosomal protein S18 acetylase RimI-like enzyme